MNKEDKCPWCGACLEMDARGNSYCPAGHFMQVVMKKEDGQTL